MPPMLIASQFDMQVDANESTKRRVIPSRSLALPRVSVRVERHQHVHAVAATDAETQRRALRVRCRSPSIIRIYVTS